MFKDWSGIFSIFLRLFFNCTSFLPEYDLDFGLLLIGVVWLVLCFSSFSKSYSYSSSPSPLFVDLFNMLPLLFLVDVVVILGNTGLSTIVVFEFWLFLICFLFEWAGIVANDSYSYVAYGSFNLNKFFENLIVLSSSASLSMSLTGNSSLKYFFILFVTIDSSRI